MSSPPAAVVGLRQPEGPRLDVRREEDEGGRDGDGELQHSSYGVGVKVQSLAVARRPVYFLCEIFFIQTKPSRRAEDGIKEP